MSFYFVGFCFVFFRFLAFVFFSFFVIIGVRTLCFFWVFVFVFFLLLFFFWSTFLYFVCFFVFFWFFILFFVGFRLGFFFADFQSFCLFSFTRSICNYGGYWVFYFRGFFAFVYRFICVLYDKFVEGQYPWPAQRGININLA